MQSWKHGLEICEYWVWSCESSSAAQVSKAEQVVEDRLNPTRDVNMKSPLGGHMDGSGHHVPSALVSLLFLSIQDAPLTPPQGWRHAGDTVSSVLSCSLSLA